VKIRHKKAKKAKKGKKREYLLQLFTRQSCSGAGAVGHGGWFMRTVCHQIVRIKEITDIPNKVS